MSLRIDLNADLGEGFDDAAIMPCLSSCNIACGGHAGDAASMRAAVALAVSHGVAVGAHPGFPDRPGFGRLVTTRDLVAIAALVSEQIGALAAIAAEAGVTLSHVKPHGALYHLAATDDSVASAVARAVRRVDPGLAMYGLAGSLALPVARAEGLHAVAEGFADRAYLADGGLAPRGAAGALIGDPERAAAQAVRLAREVDTLCLHGDTPGAVVIARRVRAALAAAGFHVACPRPPLY